MAVRLQADGSGSGKCAIYTGTDDLPFTTPLSYVSRLRFHSDLDYPAIISTHTGTWTIPAVSSATGFTKSSKNLFAHGVTGTPFVEGYMTLSSVRIPLLGSVPVNQLGGTRTAFAARWMHLGANGTYVLMNTATYGPYEGGHSTFAVPWTVYLTDTTV